MSDPLFNCIGIGIGPSNLSLACLLAPHSCRSLFLEQRPGLEWHSGLMLPGATIQVSCLKDLVSLVDPTSAYSFLNFLHDHDRLYQFINAHLPAVSRVEFNQYLGWVCRQLPSLQFGERVEAVTFDGSQFTVHSATCQWSARHVVLGVGLQPYVPPCADGYRGESVFHASQYRSRAAICRGRRVVIVGGGQSGAEIFLDLISRHASEGPEQCTWVSRRSNFAPLDDTPFTNEWFTPAYTGYFKALDERSRAAVLRAQKLASDGISASTLDAIYRTLYERQLVRMDAVPAKLMPSRSLVEFGPSSPGWSLIVTHAETVTAESLAADVVIFATGYEYRVPSFLDSISDRLERRGEELAVRDDFSVVWAGPASNRIYVQNGTREQRGVADPNLSLMSWRSGTIANSILERPVYRVDRKRSLVAWESELSTQPQWS